jgi:acyl dehydratase
MNLYFEDLAVGQTFTAGPIVVTRERLIAFATEFDPQPQHLGEAQAKNSLFGELVASGWHTGAVTMRLMIEGAMPKLAGGAAGAGVEALAWPAPVRPGDALTATGEILELRASRSRPERGLMKFRTVTTNQDGTVVQTVTATIMVPRRPTGPA